MKFNEIQGGIWKPTEEEQKQLEAEKTDRIKKNRLRIEPQSYLVEKGLSQTVFPDRYILVSGGYSGGICGSIRVYPGEGKTWGFDNAVLMTKEEAEEKLAYYQEHGYCEYT